ncbi:MAG: hypothetical protein ACLTD2_01640 [Ruminococcus sp.]
MASAATQARSKKVSSEHVEYLKGHYDYIRVNVPKPEERETIDGLCRIACGMSVGISCCSRRWKEYKTKHKTESDRYVTEHALGDMYDWGSGNSQ